VWSKYPRTCALELNGPFGVPFFDISDVAELTDTLAISVRYRALDRRSFTPHVVAHTNSSVPATEVGAAATPV